MEKLSIEYYVRIYFNSLIILRLAEECLLILIF